MMIIDRHCGLIPLSFESAELHGSVYIRHSPLLAALVTCFDMLWERATPLGPADAPGSGLLDAAERELLLMLTSGMKDTAIMRALGITQRTMTRRIARLLHTLDASTRFQAGVQAARRGLL
jgi:DNA-binding NarL/FixJ family response regulator